MRWFFLSVFGWLFMSWSVGGLVAAELIVNGDFEQGNTGFTSDYTFTGAEPTPQRGYSVVSDPYALHSHPRVRSVGDHTTGSGSMFLGNGAVDRDIVMWSQTVDVAPNTRYRFVAWVLAWSNASNSLPKLDFLINDESVGTHLADPPFVWREFSAEWNSGDNKSAVLKIVDRNLDWDGNDPALDDISFSVVPEPARSVVPEHGEILFIPDMTLDAQVNVLHFLRNA